MVDERGGNKQITPLEFGVAVMSLVTQGARACAPAEVVQFVAGRRQFGPADDTAVGRGVGIAVHDGERILRAAGRVECGNVGELLGRGRDGSARAAVEGGICHRHTCR